MGLDYQKWGPQFWFTLTTMAYMYPDRPNEVTIKKYYELIQNLPVFLPADPIGSNFSNLLDKYPVTPYLDSKKSFLKWLHFIYNQMRGHLGFKDDITMSEFINKYEDHYIPEPEVAIKDSKIKTRIVIGSVIGFLCITGIALYRK